jgi:ribulose kinase
MQVNIFNNSSQRNVSIFDAQEFVQMELLGVGSRSRLTIGAKRNRVGYPVVEQPSLPRAFGAPAG